MERQEIYFAYQRHWKFIISIYWKILFTGIASFSFKNILKTLDQDQLFGLHILQEGIIDCVFVFSADDLEKIDIEFYIIVICHITVESETTIVSNPFVMFLVFTYAKTYFIDYNITICYKLFIYFFVFSITILLSYFSIDISNLYL